MNGTQSNWFGIRRNGSRQEVFSDEVSTASGSDRVIVPANSTVLLIETRSLLLPVLTASQRSRIWRRRQRFQPHQLHALCQTQQLQHANSPPVQINLIPGQTVTS